MGEHLQKAILPKHYENYVFDLYGTLVDIHTDEEPRELWEKLVLFFGYYGAHYTPEDLKDAQTKIDYLENIKAIAKTSKNGADFKAKVRSAYPDYAGENYLDMTTGLFFK